jgi:hypothetical protein
MLKLASLAMRDWSCTSDYPPPKRRRRKPLERQIAATDSQIDRVVYDLYGLTEDEIKIVERLCRNITNAPIGDSVPRGYYRRVELSLLSWDKSWRQVVVCCGKVCRG